MKHPFEKGRYRINFLLIFLMIISFSSFAQQNNPLINSGDLIKQGAALHDQRKFKEAIELYKKISRSDTNYSDALYELSNSCYADSQFNAAYQYASEALKLYPEQFSKFSMQAANALDELKRGDEALALYDQAIAKNPQSALIYFNKAIGLIQMQKEKEAIKTLQQCLLINPYQNSAHYFLGYLYLKAGKLIPSMLALQTYLVVAPDGKYSSSSVQLLGAIAKVTDDVLGYVKTKEASKEDNFDDLQEIVLSKVSLDKQYKLKADLEDNIVRQIQVVNEKLEYNRNDKGFCMQYYVPLYQKLFAENNFEPMIFNLFSGLGIKDVDNWIKHNKKKVEDFAIKAGTYLNEIRSTRKLIPDERTNPSVNYLYDDGKLLGEGSYKKGKNDKLQLFGQWEFYHDNGTIKAKGTFGDDEKKEGAWNYYYDNGQMKERANYKNDNTDGLSEGWFDNGNKWYVESYKDGKLDGTQTIYYYNENLKSITAFSSDKKNGLQKNYNTKGELTYIVNYTNDKQDGISKSYYASGNVKNVVTYKDDKAEGTYKSFGDDGTLLIQGEFVNDLRQGLWSFFYDDGGIKEKTTYKDNEITGEFTEYFPNGKLSRKGNYTKKKIDGKLEDYDDDGKIYSDAVYEKGKLREINFYDKSGNNISTTTTRRGAADITFYSPEGIRLSECYFNKDGDRDGENISYYPSGKISSKTMYKDGEQDGSNVTYFPNGQKKEENAFVKGDEDGYSKEYFENGKMSYEGWIVKGEKQQHSLYYNHFQDLTTKENYLDDEANGYIETKYPGNIPDCEYKYHTGWLQQVTQFDSTGKVIADNLFKQGKGPLVYYNYNGKKSAEGYYDHYYLNGPYKIYFCDGTLFSLGYYKNDKRDSAYKSYYLGGALRSEGNYKDGDKQGVWKYYFENGKLSEKEIYKNGKLNGLDTLYNIDGTFDKIINYKDNNKDGQYKIFGDNNQLVVLLNYKDDDIKSYTYEDKTGQLVPPVMLKKNARKVVAYYKNGIQSAEINFVDNDIQGVRKFFYSTGKVFVDGTREYGYDNGLRKTYYPNGNIWKEETYVLGNLQGTRKVYYPNGKLDREENFYNDDNHGVCKYYDEQGKLKQTRVYYYGNLLSIK